MEALKMTMPMSRISNIPSQLFSRSRVQLAQLRRMAFVLLRRLVIHSTIRLQAFLIPEITEAIEQDRVDDDGNQDKQAQQGLHPEITDHQPAQQALLQQV